MLALRRVPRTGDVFERGESRFEVVDMDGNRVDRLLASRIAPLQRNTTVRMTARRAGAALA